MSYTKYFLIALFSFQLIHSPQSLLGNYQMIIYPSIIEVIERFRQEIPYISPLQILTLPHSILNSSQLILIRNYLIYLFVYLIIVYLYSSQIRSSNVGRNSFCQEFLLVSPDLEQCLSHRMCLNKSIYYYYYLLIYY